MRLYTTSGATQVDDPVHGTFTAGPSGAFDFPDDLSDRLRGVHIGKKPAWETDAERVRRVNDERLQSVRDPAALYEAVREMADTQKGLGVSQSVLLAAVVKALGIDVPGLAAATPPPAPPAGVPAPPDDAEAQDDEAEQPAGESGAAQAAETAGPQGAVSDAPAPSPAKPARARKSTAAAPAAPAA